MNTFEKSFANSPSFLERLVSWRPDYIVPVAKKGCKLLKSCAELPNVRIDSERVRYRHYFELREPVILGKRIAVVDDATQYTSTLLAYRKFFEAKGAIVGTFSFVGHERLFEGRNDKYDEAAEIGRFLPGPVYQEYILQQSYWLLQKGHHFDLDHLIFEARLPKADFDLFCVFLRRHGQLLSLPDYFPDSPIKRFSLNNILFHSFIPFITEGSVTYGPINKLKFSYDSAKALLAFSPMVFPTWDAQAAKTSPVAFADCPFKLPFAAIGRIDVSNPGLLLRTYANISWMAAISLTQSFVALAKEMQTLSSPVTVRRGDLDATFGSDVAQTICESATIYVNQLARPAAVRKPVTYATIPRLRGHRFRGFGDVIDHCKTRYERKVSTSRRRVGVHYYLPYEQLFGRYEDLTELSESLDYHCDLGVIVPETILRDGKIFRACRTGEPDSDTSWKRTQLLIPLAIDQLRKQLGHKIASVEPMLLNKVLANFLFDYPWEENRDLHCLLGVPNDFGTLVHVHHRNRAPTPMSFYAADRISPHYIWEKATRTFVATPASGFRELVKDLFDERQEIPFTTITTYFRLLGEIYKQFKSVDVLNLLSIGREENCFYNHVLFNVRTGFSELSLVNDSMDVEATGHSLYESGKQAASARDKLTGARGMSALMKRIKQTFENEYEFLTALATIERNCYSFTSEFYATLDLLDQITHLQALLCNIGLLFKTGSEKYFKQAQKFHSALHKTIHIEFPSSSSPLRQRDVFEGLWKRLFPELKNRMLELPREEPPLVAKIVHDARRRARNIATNYCYSNKLSALTFLYIDFSGLRRIPEPKEDIISEYYRIVEKSSDRRGGVKLYGGRDGDDAYTLLFRLPAHATLCADDIKREWQSSLFLSRTDCDVKFGISYSQLPEQDKEPVILQCWGHAKDMCEFKGPHFRNRGNLLIDHKTHVALEQSDHANLLTEFELLDGVETSSGEKVYCHKRLLSFPVRQQSAVT
jgi:hypothetical protein